MLSEIIESLKANNGKVGEMTVTKVKIHDDLGVTFDFNKRKVLISMKFYIEQILKDLTDGMQGTATSPAAEYVLKSWTNHELLDKETAELFHQVIQLYNFCVQKNAQTKMTKRSYHE